MVQSQPIWLEELGSRAVMFTVAPTSMLQVFKKKYKLGYMDFAEIFSFPGELPS